MAVEIENGPKFDRGSPKALFDTLALGIVVPITVVVNWPAALKK